MPFAQPSSVVTEEAREEDAPQPVRAMLLVEQCRALSPARFALLPFAATQTAEFIPFRSTLGLGQWRIRSMPVASSPVSTLGRSPELETILMSGKPVPRLAKTTGARAPPLPLITRHELFVGGTSALGMQMVCWRAAQGSACVILSSGATSATDTAPTAALSPEVTVHCSGDSWDVRGKILGGLHGRICAIWHATAALPTENSRALYGASSLHVIFCSLHLFSCAQPHSWALLSPASTGLMTGSVGQAGQATTSDRLNALAALRRASGMVGLVQRAGWNLVTDEGGLFRASPSGFEVVSADLAARAACVHLSALEAQWQGAALLARARREAELRDLRCLGVVAKRREQERDECPVCCNNRRRRTHAHTRSPPPRFATGSPLASVCYRFS